MEFKIEIRPFTELEMSDRGIDGTDVAVAVAVGGEIIGYTDDYGTATIFRRDGRGEDTDTPNIGVIKKETEAIVNVAGHLWESLQG